ncbi:MAG: hypothetical protein J6125_03815 [Clostridia bacterium]|nr:hypothetical protein [Clostridia bacterium]
MKTNKIALYSVLALILIAAAIFLFVYQKVGTAYNYGKKDMSKYVTLNYADLGLTVALPAVGADEIRGEAAALLAQNKGTASTSRAASGYDVVSLYYWYEYTKDARVIIVSNQNMKPGSPVNVQIGSTSDLARILALRNAAGEYAGSALENVKGEDYHYNTLTSGMPAEGDTAFVSYRLDGSDEAVTYEKMILSDALDADYGDGFAAALLATPIGSTPATLTFGDKTYTALSVSWVARDTVEAGYILQDDDVVYATVAASDGTVSVTYYVRADGADYTYYNSDGTPATTPISGDELIAALEAALYTPETLVACDPQPTAASFEPDNHVSYYLIDGSEATVYEDGTTYYFKEGTRIGSKSTVDYVKIDTPAELGDYVIKAFVAAQDVTETDFGDDVYFEKDEDGYYVRATVWSADGEYYLANKGTAYVNASTVLETVLPDIDYYIKAPVTLTVTVTGITTPGAGSVPGISAPLSVDYTVGRDEGVTVKDENGDDLPADTVVTYHLLPVSVSAVEVTYEAVFASSSVHTHLPEELAGIPTIVTAYKGWQTAIAAVSSAYSAEADKVTAFRAALETWAADNAEANKNAYDEAKAALTEVSAEKAETLDDAEAACVALANAIGDYRGEAGEPVTADDIRTCEDWLNQMAETQLNAVAEETLKEHNLEEYRSDVATAAWDAMLARAEVTYPARALRIAKREITNAYKAEYYENEENTAKYKTFRKYMTDRYGESYKDRIEEEAKANIKPLLVAYYVAQQKGIDTSKRAMIAYYTEHEIVYYYYGVYPISMGHYSDIKGQVADEILCHAYVLDVVMNGMVDANATATYDD